MKKKAIIVDLDGTLYDSSGRKHYVESEKPNFDKFYQAAKFDRPHEWCAEIVKRFASDHAILYVSGRPDLYRDEAWDWMEKWGLPLQPQAKLFMREIGDFRKDTVIKKEIYDDIIKDRYEIAFALDDRPSVCRMWRELGITVLQCQDKEF